MSDRPLQAPWLQGGGGGGMNPLGMASDLMQLQTRRQELLQAQQGFQARQVFGNILTSSRTPEEAEQKWNQSGMAGFFPDALTQMRTLALLGAQTSQAQNEATRSGLAASGDVWSSLLHAGAISTGFDDYERNFNAVTGMWPASVRNNPAVMSAAQAVHDSWMNDRPTGADPQADNAEFKKRWLAHNAAVATPEQFHGVIGTPTKIATTGGEIGALQDPTGAISYPPGQTTLPGRLPPTGAGEAPLAGDGKALYDTSMVDPRYATGAVPMGPQGPIITKGDADTNEDLRKQFVEQLPQFRASQNTTRELANMDREVEYLAGRGEGGLLTPGTGMEQRTEIARGINTFYQAIGKEPPFDPEKVAASEGLFKSARSLAFQFRDQVEGHSRPAVQDLIQAGQSVPGVENSYLGAKLLIEATKAGANRVADERRFVDWWRGQHNGLYLGAYEAFDKAHPSSEYSHQVFSQFGLQDNGKFPPGDEGIATVRRLVGQGLLTPGQAKSIFRSQFGATE